MSRPQPDLVTNANLEQLLTLAATQLGDVGARLDDRNDADGVQLLAESTHRLVALATQLDVYARGRAEMLAGAAEIAMTYTEADPDPYGKVMAGLDEGPARRRAWRILGRLRGGGRHAA